jgi:plastocyanin
VKNTLRILAVLASLGIAAVAPASETAAPEDGGSLDVHVDIERLATGSQSPPHDSPVVFLEDAPADSGPGLPKGPFSLTQQDKTFKPPLLIVPVGAIVDFPNKDRVLHNVYSGSDAKKFHLGLFGAGDTRTVTFDAPGIVQVFCNIHPQMAATILVLQNGFFGHPDLDGNVHFEHVPVGTWKVAIWFPFGKGREETIDVSKGAKAAVHATVIELADPRRHAKEDGKPYGQY